MITIYGHSRCGWCTKAKKLAESYNLEYNYKDTDIQENLNDLKKDLPNVKTVPQIWWDNRYIGGYEDFAAEIENTRSDYGNGEI
jgi:glutaredoxin 1